MLVLFYYMLVLFYFYACVVLFVCLCCFICMLVFHVVVFLVVCCVLNFTLPDTYPEVVPVTAVSSPGQLTNKQQTAITETLNQEVLYSMCLGLMGQCGRGWGSINEFCIMYSIMIESLITCILPLKFFCGFTS